MKILIEDIEEEEEEEDNRQINLNLVLLGILDKPSAQLRRSNKLTIQPPQIAMDYLQEDSQGSVIPYRVMKALKQSTSFMHCRYILFKFLYKIPDINVLS